MTGQHGKDRLFFSGATLQQAVLAAARHLGLDPDAVAYVRREKTSGFVKAPKVVIEVDPAAPRRVTRAVAAADPPPLVATPAGARRQVEGQPPAARPRRSPMPRAARRPEGEGEGDAPAEGAPPRSPQELAEGLGEAARRLIELAGLDVEAELRREGSGWRVLLRGADEARLAADRPLREAFEHLLPRLLRGLVGMTAGARVVVGQRDSEREQELLQLAEDAARRVRESGEPVVLPEMNSFERRVVHVALAVAPGIVTESEGEGANRRVVVRPGP